MSNKLTSFLAGVLLLLAFFVLVLLNNQLLGSARLDLTENQVYSLSDGSKQILAEIEEPVQLYFFFSDKASKGMTSLRNYANRVESLLQEYRSASGGKIQLHIIDPEPFSEAEDEANRFGLTAATIGQAGDAIYMGLAARNAFDDEKVIAFFDPQQESFLEYEISKLIYQLSDPQKVKVTLLSDLAVNGGQNPMTGRFDPAWTSISQLQQLYDVEQLGTDADAIPQDTDVLLLIHPKNLSDALQFSIDQYAMKGGKVLMFVDPHHESDPMGGMGGANSSDLEKLFAAWGFSFDPGQVVLDAATGLDIRTQTGVARHMGFLGLGVDQLDSSDVTTRGLEMINGASLGALKVNDGAAIKWSPLLQSSSTTSLVDSMRYAMTRDVKELANDFVDSQQVHVLAARVSGKAESAYEETPEGVNAEDFKQSTDNLNVIVVADTDLLTDRFWVSQANFFGQTIFTPFANNGDFLTNAVENLGGSNALISIRSRGTFSRPFDRVQELTVKAEQAFRDQEQLLQQQLDETEQQLAELQGQRNDSGALVLSESQQQALEDFLQKKIEIRKALREVRHQLDKDIEALGSWLKLINIAAAPVILVLFLSLLARLLRRKAGGMQ
ncbi:Gldg family protein [Aliiglaciecola sp. CAU 1673]|uniref:GldG family protein n=1 Tax=Aliiglaciecola sp. CAU 1673 TaxID=3032595 RepID=UPI0023DC2245|nr:Gldg family protein [Aliiglaciecola sp. CAU 1673]MDF2179599.1 Gldg family protein [Aliiglaciecola sp. CAU 1673]